MVGPPIYNRLTYGTFSTSGPPPRIDWCGRRYIWSERVQSLFEVNVLLGGLNSQARLTQVGTTPSGLPIVARVMSPNERAKYHTDVCAMELWVKLGPDSYLLYGLSGGP
jgi:hypothetical protein